MYQVERVYADYDFSCCEGIDIDNIVATTEAADNNRAIEQPKTANDLAVLKLNIVLIGNDDDSVLTMGNPLTPQELQSQKSRSSLLAGSLATSA